MSRAQWLTISLLLVANVFTWTANTVFWWFE
jgi:hypothetical protein